MAKKPVTESASIVERVYDATRKAILSGRYQPGQRLRLQDIAAETDASFIPVREALRLLEAGRLVEIIPNKGARVTDISQEDMLDAYSLRIVLESIAVEWACANITEEEVSLASHYRAAMLEAHEKGDVSESGNFHRAFHTTIYQAARSPWLMHLIDLLMSNTDRYRRLLTPARPSNVHMTEIDRQHTRILDAVAQGNVAEARKALTQHLEDTQERFKKGLAERV